MTHTPAAAAAWQQAIFKVLKAGGVRQVAYVPDAGHSHVIRSVVADPESQSLTKRIPPFDNSIRVHSRDSRGKP